MSNSGRVTRVRSVRIVMNPAYSKPIEQITDRAKRYRAHHPDVVPNGPKQCGFCGAGRGVIPHHILGDESKLSKKGLMWACRSCNAKVAHVMKRAKLGKRTAQFNPSKRGASTPGLKAYGDAIKVMRGDFEGNVAKAMQTIHSTPPSVRSQYTRRSWSTRKQVYGPSGRQARLFDSDVPF